MNRLRRGILGTIILASMIFLLKGARRHDNAVPADRIVVRYWEKWTGLEADQMKQIVDEFNATVGAEKHIWVSYLSMTAVDQKTLLATAAGVPPDIAGIWDAQLGAFAAMGALEPLDYLAAAHGLTREHYKPVFYDGCAFDGHLFGLPSTPGVVALHYNKRIFRERSDALRAAGLDPNRAPRSIAELDRYAQILDTRDSRGRLVSAGYLPQEPGWWLSLTQFWFDADIYDPQTRKLSLTSPRVLDAFTWLQGYTKRLGAQTIQEFRTTIGRDNFDSPQSPFFTGTVVMEQEGPWKANYIQKLNPSMSNRRGLPPERLSRLTRDERRDNCDWAVAPFPSINPDAPPVCFAGMDVFVIPSTAKHKREAFEFIAFVSRPEIMEKLVSMHCKNSPLAKMSPEYIANHPNPYIEVFEELASSPGDKPLPPIPIWPEVRAELENAIDRICLGEATPLDALTDAQARAQLALDRFFQRQELHRVKHAASQ